MRDAQAVTALNEAGNALLQFISDNVKSGQAKKNAVLAISRGLGIAGNEISKYGTKPYRGPEPEAAPVEPVGPDDGDADPAEVVTETEGGRVY